MNRDNILEYLLKHLSQFSCHNNFFAEVIALIYGSGYEKRFFALLTTRLRQLSVMGAQAVKLEEFERINEQLYSMHFQGRGFNIRFMYSFLPNGEPVFLVPFYERSGKRKTDYTPYIPVATARLEEMKEEFINEYGK